MSGFRLIGIVPLAGCGKQFLKNLSVGEKYCFYKGYEVKLNEDQSSIKSVNYKPSTKDLRSLNFYNSPNDINISVSALVGENGSGKSSLIELLYYAIYFMGTRYSKLQASGSEVQTIIDNSPNRINHELIEVRKFKRKWNLKSLLDEKKEILLARIIRRYGININEKSEKKSINVFINEKLKERETSIKRRQTEAKKIEKRLSSNLNVAIIFEADLIRCIEIIKGNVKSYKFENGSIIETTDFDQFNLEDFFYTVSVNYSHHSLNSNSMGEWINALFHKNDGYQTPVVINPMRNNGNFDVNHEITLLKERLIGNVTYNLFKNPDYKLLGKYRFDKFIFTPKRNTGDETVGIKPMDFDENYFGYDPIGKILNCKGISSIEYDQITERALAYLDKKVFRIPEQYPFLFKEEVTRENFEELVSFINMDSTHITKKISQTVYFLNSYNKTQELRDLWSSSKDSIILSKNQMIQWLSSFQNIMSSIEKDGNTISPYYFSLFSLPGFMKVDFEITDLEKGKTFKLSELSSGEQQIILNLSSISYHLNNLQSIHETDKDRIKYKNINIVLDEIELYYHPNSQRKMVKDLLGSINEIGKRKEGIQSVNIVFSTHSPFILSDIPDENILRLEDGKVSTRNFKQTFGANIHNILANDFFLDNGFMGDFSKSLINGLIDSLKDEKEYSPEKQNELLIKCELIGEDILRNSLLELYRKKFDGLSYAQLLNFYNKNQHGAN